MRGGLSGTTGAGISAPWQMRGRFIIVRRMRRGSPAIAAGEDGNTGNSGNGLVARESALELLDREHALHAEAPDELGDSALVGGAESAEGEGGRMG